MKALYVSQYFPPEIGAPAVRVSQMTTHWRAAGHDARVLTGFPNHPDGVVPPEYRAKLRRLVCTEEYRGVPVYRTWLYPAANKGVIGRSANYGSFMLSAAVRGRGLGFRPDVVIGTSPQLLCPVAAASIARRHRARFVFEVRDLWPESLEAVGVCAKGSLPYRLLDRVASRLYRQAWKVVVVTETFRMELIERGVPAEKICVVTNGVDTDFFRPDVTPPDEIAANECLRGKFLVSYVGTLGMAHGLDTLLDCAKWLLGRTEIQFLVVGTGAERERLERRSAEEGISNVTFTGPRPWSEIPGYLAASGACVVHLSRSPLFETVLPSKMFEVMAAGRPIILGVEGEAKRMLEKARAGIAVEPENPSQMRDAILGLSENAGLAERFGANGREYACGNCSYAARARDYWDVLSPGDELPERLTSPVARASAG